MSLALRKQAGARAAQPSRGAVRVHAAARPLWLPGSTPPAHLTGKLAGDFGFDPLGLGKDPQALLWYQQAELVHCRTAMTAVAGILIPSVLTKLGVLNVPAWWEAGKVSAESTGIALGPLFCVQMFMCGFVEGKRWMDIRKPGSQAEKGTFLGFETSLGGTNEVGYPGGPFDPLNLSKESAEKFADLKLKEVKNGRLAMLALLGFSAQHGAWPGKDPVDNLIDHVKDPFHVTFMENGLSVPSGFGFFGL